MQILILLYLLCLLCCKETNSFKNNLQAHVKVIALYCDENKVRRAGPGENVRIRISGIEEEEIIAGFVLSSVGKYLLFFFSSWHYITSEWV